MSEKSRVKLTEFGKELIKDQEKFDEFMENAADEGKITAEEGFIWLYCYEDEPKFSDTVVRVLLRLGLVEEAEEVEEQEEESSFLGWLILIGIQMVLLAVLFLRLGVIV